jgi:hypothetical protein
MEAKTVDVHICQCERGSSPTRIAIETIWGTGYQLEAADRRRAMDLILKATEDDAVGRSQDAPGVPSKADRGPPGLTAPWAAPSLVVALVFPGAIPTAAVAVKPGGSAPAPIGRDCMGWLATWP